MYLYKGERGTKNIAAFFVPLCAFIVFFVFNPNRSLDRSTVLFFWKKALRAFCSLLPASYFPACLDVARYAFCKPKSNPQDIRGQSTQSLMTDLGLNLCTLLKDYVNSTLAGALIKIKKTYQSRLIGLYFITVLYPVITAEAGELEPHVCHN